MTSESYTFCTTCVYFLSLHKPFTRSLQKTVYITCFVVLHILACAQQSLRFRRLDVSDGLSQNTVVCMLQDLNGFMWMGTQDGLNRYDGYSFKIYRNRENDPASISNNYIMSLAVDTRGNIWAGTTNGLNRIDGRNGRLTRIRLDSLIKKATDHRIHAICAAKNGNVYFAMNRGAFYADTNGNIKALAEFNALKLPIRGIFEKHGKLWLDAHFKVISMDCATHRIVDSVLSSKEYLQLRGVGENTLLYEQEGLLYTSPLSGGKSSPAYARQVNPNSSGNCISVFTGYNEQWLCTDNGLFWQRGKDTLLIKHIPDYEYSLSSDFTYCVFKDRSGLYWIGTSRGGVCIFDPAWQDFKIIGKPAGLNVAVWNMTMKGDTLILATAKGIRLYKKNKGIKRISSSFLPEQALTEITLPALQKPLEELLCTALCVDAKNNLWVGTENGGLFRYDPRNKSVKKLVKQQDSASISDNNIFHICKLSPNSIGISTPYGFSEIDINTFRVRRIYISYLNKNVLNNYIVKSYPEKNNLWFCSAQGLCRLNTKNNVLDQFLPDRKNITEQYHNIMSDFRIDTKGRYWTSTFGYGLLQLDVATGNFERYGTAQGLKNETILGILEDDQNKLWVGTHEGIAKFDPGTKRFENFGPNEGIDGKESTENGFYKSTEGDLFFGTVSGLVVFDPEAVHSKESKSPMVLSGLKVNYKNADSSGYITAGNGFSPQKIDFDYKAKTITFEFASLNFLNADNTLYKYRLEGFSDSWVTVNSAERHATYTNLDPGTYTFNVVPQLNGRDSGRLSFIVKVRPPFWLTWWFMLLCAVSVILLVVFIVRYYAQRKLKERLRKVEADRKVQKEKERISRELHDNVGSQLTYIIQSLDALSYKSGQEGSPIAGRLDALGEFSRDTMNQLRESIWAINSKVITLNELLTKMHEYLNKIRPGFEKTEIRLVRDGVPNRELNPYVAINCFRIVQEAINNSLKYSGAGLIEISVKALEDGRLEFSVTDNGCGFDLQAKSKGYGLGNMRLRAREIKAELWMDSAQGKGSSVRFVTG